MCKICLASNEQNGWSNIVAHPFLKEGVFFRRDGTDRHVDPYAYIEFIYTPCWIYELAEKMGIETGGSSGGRAGG